MIVVPHDTLLKRIRAEFLEMPGLRLTLEQTQRLCGVDRALCEHGLSMLVDMKFLCIKPNGMYARLTDGTDPSAPRQTAVREVLREAAASRDGATRSPSSAGIPATPDS